MRDVLAMERMTKAERAAAIRRFMMPRHWAYISEDDKRLHPRRFLCYQQALGVFADPNMIVYAKDLSQLDLSRMPLSEAMDKLYLRLSAPFQPVDGDGPDAQSFAF